MKFWKTGSKLSHIWKLQQKQKKSFTWSSWLNPISLMSAAISWFRCDLQSTLTRYFGDNSDCIVPINTHIASFNSCVLILNKPWDSNMAAILIIRFLSVGWRDEIDSMLSLVTRALYTSAEVSSNSMCCLQNKNVSHVNMRQRDIARLSDFSELSDLLPRL